MGRNRPRFDDWDEEYYEDRRGSYRRDSQRDRREKKRMKYREHESLYDDE